MLSRKAMLGSNGGTMILCLIGEDNSLGAMGENINFCLSGFGKNMGRRRVGDKNSCGLIIK